MPISIRDALNRRGDLSTFVVHLTKDQPPGGPNARAVLETIIAQRMLRANTPMGWAAAHAPAGAARDSQRVVCFSETPLEHIYSLAAEIIGRQVRLAPYGLVFTKLAARRAGINPVWYVDMTMGRDWEIAHALDDLRATALATGAFQDHPAARILPFVEGMGTWHDTQKEFWWEREWRHQGDLAFDYDDVAMWLAPEADVDAIESLIIENQLHAGLDPDDLSEPFCIDPSWGVEAIVAHLLGHGEDVTPFGPR